MKSRTVEFIRNMSTGDIRLILETDPSLPAGLEILLLRELLKRYKDSATADDK